MRNLILIAAVSLLASCAPGKSNKLVRVDIYCDSCYAKVMNYWQAASGDNGGEVAFEGDIMGSKSINIYRFNSQTACVAMTNYYSYTTDTVDIYIIENNDTLQEEHHLSLNTSFCY